MLVRGSTRVILKFLPSIVRLPGGCLCFRFLWDFMMLMLLIANLVVLPVAIAFFNEENSEQWAVFNCINDGIFILDILLNFRTGIPRQHMAVQVSSGGGRVYRPHHSPHHSRKNKPGTNQIGAISNTRQFI